MLKEFVKFFGELPFSGKFEISRQIERVFRSRNAKERRERLTSCGLFLSLLIGCHALQAHMGMQLIRKAENRIVSTLAIWYMMANAGAVITQVYLGWRVWQFVRARRGRYYRGGKKRKMKQFSNKERKWSVALTLLAQIVFLICYVGTV